MAIAFDNVKNLGDVPQSKKGATILSLIAIGATKMYLTAVFHVKSTDFT